MKILIKNCFSVFWRVIFANFVCIFLLVAVTTIFTAIATKDIGYIAYGAKEGQTENKELYTYYYSDGDDIKKSEFEEQGYVVSESPIRSDMSKTSRAVFLVVSQVVCLYVAIQFIYSILWSFGNKDSNKVHFGRMAEDRLRGFKYGLAGSAVSIISYLALIVFKLGVYENFGLIVYKFINCYYFSFIDVILGKAATVSELSVWRLALLVLPIFVIPLVSQIAYTLGYKDISLMEKLVYKKKDK